MKKYKVLTPLIVFGIREENGEKKDYTLKEGATVDLPENDIAVRALVARNQIKETEEKNSKK